MAKTIEARTYEEALAWLRDNGFDVTDAPGTNSRVFLTEIQRIGGNSEGR